MITESNDCYSITGATYGVYADKSCKEQLATLTTDNSGSTETVELKAATYYVKETKAPKGFQLDTPAALPAGADGTLAGGDGSV